MVSPLFFGFNNDTAKDNIFQNNLQDNQNTEKACFEHNSIVKLLEDNGVEVVLIKDVLNDSCEHTPDSIFPNNWFSTFGKNLILYPMMAKNRRAERKQAPLSFLLNEYKSTFLDLTNFEIQDQFLEGTGSLVFDHINKKAFACLSSRTSQKVLDILCKNTGYTKFTFNQTIGSLPIYHTNVMMAIGTKWAVVGSDKAYFDKEIEDRKIIRISESQVKEFCGNILELQSKEGQTLIVMSTRSYKAFTKDQIESLKEFGKIIHTDIPTIENIGGGGIRCTIAELF
jgi:hypothetical protein